jgi:hypothetical protein
VAGKSIAYDAEQLMRLVANQGNCARTASELIDDDFQVPRETLARWKTDLYAEQYRRLEDQHGKELEQEAVEQARLNIQLAGQKKRTLLEQVPDKPPVDQIAALLKAVTDAESKGVQGLLQLTGRPTNPQGNSATNDVVQLLQKMKEVGFVSFAPGVSIEPVKVRNEASGEDAG